MSKFKNYITASGQGSAPSFKVGRWELMRLVHRYPWFTTARVVRAELYEREDERVYLSKLIPIPELQPTSDSTVHEAIETRVVDNFLALGKYAINRTEEDGRAESLLCENAADEDDDEFYTEELAQIYANQGLFAEARKIYVKLSLRYPKKSVYFAEIISQLDEKL